MVGGIVGGIVVNEAPENRQQCRVYGITPSYSPDRAANAEVQISLNYFGFPAGTPDGVMGSRSRAAVAQYQAFMGYGPTGYTALTAKPKILGALRP